MTKVTELAERLLDGGDGVDGVDVGELLASVRRIADGLEGVKALAVEGAVARGTIDYTDSLVFARATLVRLRQLLDSANKQSLVDVTISYPLLVDTIRVLSGRVGEP